MDVETQIRQQNEDKDTKRKKSNYKAKKSGSQKRREVERNVS